MCLDATRCSRRPIAAQTSNDEFFTLMSQRLAGEGGLIPETALRERWRQQGRKPAGVDDLLGDHGLRSITRGQERWLPAFQLNDDGCSPRVDVAVVGAELEGAMDDAEILAWFACGNASLDDETPIVRMRSSLPAVLDAARLDRFIVSD